MIEVPDGLARSPRFWDDPDGRAWLADLPALVEATCREWDLAVDGAPRHGSHALVLPVTAPDGPAALRLTPPGPRAADDLRALRFWSAGVVVSVRRARDDGSALLLERLDADAALTDRPVDEVAEVLGGLAAALAVPDPPADVPSTADAARGLAERQWPEAVPASVVDRAVGLAADLATDDPGLAVDGDVHADQVLRDAGGAWRVVDPLLMRGDPAYDLARAVWTTADRLPDDRAVRRFADVLVDATGLDRSRAGGWLVVRTAEYWRWCLGAGLTEDPVRCARVLAALTGEA